MKTCLSVAGSDCSGGAGIQADLKTFSANGCYGMSVIVSVVAENTSGVISHQTLNQSIIRDQLDAVFQDITVDGVKIGMLPDAETMKTVAEKLVQYNPRITVVDPVMEAKDGYALMDPGARATLIDCIIPYTYLLTPNIPEAELLTGRRIHTLKDMEEAARDMVSMGAGNVLIKGGHFRGDATDLLFDGKRIHTFTRARIQSRNPHGTGCTLSSAITANLAGGDTVEQAVERAKEYMTGAILHSLPIGKGNGPVNHFYQFYQKERI